MVERQSVAARKAELEQAITAKLDTLSVGAVRFEVQQRKGRVDRINVKVYPRGSTVDGEGQVPTA